MKILKNVFIIVLLLGFSNFLKAQYYTDFPADSAKFISSLKSFMTKNKTTTKKEAELVKELETMWEDGSIDSSLRNIFFKTSNILLHRNAKAYPHFDLWIRTTMAYVKSDRIGNNFYQFQDAIVMLCESRKNRLRHIYSFLQTINNIITRNSFFDNGATVWKHSNKNYIFDFSDKNLQIKYPQGTLTCLSVRDSIKLYNTSGVFDPIKKIWTGNGGKTYWDRAGYSKDSVFATFGKYKINTKLAKYSIDSVTFYNYYFTNKPFFGVLKHRVTVFKNPVQATYPEFSTYDSKFQLKNIFNDINYEGGLKMRGAKLMGIGVDANNAKLDIYRDVQVVENNDTIIKKMLFMKVASQYFSLSGNSIISKNAKVSIKLESDSLYHPGLQFTYNNSKRTIELLRSNRALNMSRSPYYDSYHNFEIDAPLVTWTLGDSKLYISSLQGAAISNTQFSSYNLYKPRKYFVYQGFDFTHPFVKIRRYTRKHKTRKITAVEMANIIIQPEHEARKFLLNLTYNGFANYDNVTQKGFLTQKLYDYLDYVVGEKDYDLIDIQSTTNGKSANAILNLHNLDILVNGVEQVHISDSQRVNIYPKQEEIVLKKNRKMDFGGVIETGFYTFFGDGFSFDYEKFGVELKHIDSLHIKVIESIDELGNPVLKNVQSTMENITGYVYIDDPNNKSGIKHFPKYPIFKTTKDSYVYYDRPSIAGGVYTRDTFYFRVDPYEIDSLNSFSAQGLTYTGTFHAGNIFPAMNEELKLQSDNSLGFVHKIDSAGVPAYGGKGTLHDTMKMSNEGLIGIGKLDYLNSESWSSKMMFYPDSMLAFANKFVNHKVDNTVSEPKIESVNLGIRWLQKKDVMHCSTTDSVAHMYENQASFKGTFSLTPKEIRGHGRLFVERGSVKSADYSLLANVAKANVSEFTIKSVNQNALAFTTDSVKTTIDFIERIGKFESLSALNPILLPENQFKVFATNYEWAIDNNNIVLEGNLVHSYENGKHMLFANSDKDHPRGNLFVSTHPLQKEFNYISPNTEFDLNSNVLSSHKVKFLFVADARIILNDGEFTVNPKAKYKTIVKADIIANTTTKYHKFYDATVNIFGKDNYSASGNYDYVDVENKKQTVRFDVIGVDTTETTFAKGKIVEDNSFTLSPAFSYRGDVRLYAPEKNLIFDGYFKTNKTDEIYQHHWVRFNSSIDAKKVQIPVDSISMNINNKRVYKGIMLEKDSIHILPRFFTFRHHYTDEYVSTATGVIQYDFSSKKYEIAPVEKLKNRDTTLDYLACSSETGNLQGDGNVSFTVNLGQIKIGNIGTSLYNLKDKDLVLNIFSTIDFYFNKQALQAMADTIKSLENLNPINMLSPKYRKGLSNLVGCEEADKLLNEQKLFGAFKKFPNKLSHTFVLSNVSLKWVQKDGSFHSFGDIDVSSILNTQVNRKLKGAIQVGPSTTGDYFALYLEASPDLWYFFKYKRGIMYAVSSDTRFNQIIKSTKKRNRKQKVERGEPKFYYYFGIKSNRNRFLNDFYDAEKTEPVEKKVPDKTKDKASEIKNSAKDDIKTDDTKKVKKKEKKEVKTDDDKNKK